MKRRKIIRDALLKRRKIVGVGLRCVIVGLAIAAGIVAEGSEFTVDDLPVLALGAALGMATSTLINFAIDRLVARRERKKRKKGLDVGVK